MPRRFRARAAVRATIALLICAVVLTACATIPGTSNPRVIGDFGGGQSGQRDIAPQVDAAPEVIVRDFLKANAVVDNNYAASRRFLVAGGEDTWEVPDRAVVVRNIDVIPTDRSDEMISATIRGQATGYLGSDGTFEPANESITQNVQLVPVDGQWRIQGLSSVGDTPMLVIDTDQFRSVYSRYLLYFPDPTGRTLVSDARWLANDRQELPAALMSLLVRGPPARLVDAVSNPFGPNASVRGAITDALGSQAEPGVAFAGVRVDFSGVPALDPDAARLLAGQVVWTFAGADVQGPYLINVDGLPLDESYAAGWNPNDVAASNPNTSADLAVGLHGVVDGRFVRVSDTALQPVAGPLGAATNINMVGMSNSGRQVAAVTNSAASPPAGPGAPLPGVAPGAAGVSLSVAPYGGIPTQVLTAASMTRPSWMPDDTTVWTVLDGTRVVRVIVDPATGMVSTGEVDATEVFAAAGGQITELRLARDGVRVALIAGGQVYTGVIVPRPDGTPAIARLAPVMFDRPLVPTTLDWQSGDSFMVGRNTADSPVVSVRPDSGDIVALPSRNLSPPVAALAVSTDMVYATDSSGVWSIGTSIDNSEEYWNQVDRLAGGQASPVLPG